MSLTSATFLVLSFFLHATPVFAAEDPVDFVRREIGSSLHEPQDFLTLDNGDAGVVVSLSAMAPAITGPTGEAPAERSSFYVYLSIHAEGWKVFGAASALTEELRLRSAELRAISAIDMTKTSSLSEARAEWIRSRILLAGSPDEALVAHFVKNRSLFEKIRATVSEPQANQYAQIEFAPPFDEFFSNALIEYGERQITIGGSTEAICKAPDCLTLAITFLPPRYRLGYIYAADATKLPPMSEDDYVLIRPLGDGWYVFRQK